MGMCLFVRGQYLYTMWPRAVGLLKYPSTSTFNRPSSQFYYNILNDLIGWYYSGTNLIYSFTTRLPSIKSMNEWDVVEGKKR